MKLPPSYSFNGKAVRLTPHSIAEFILLSEVRYESC